MASLCVCMNQQGMPLYIMGLKGIMYQDLYEVVVSQKTELHGRINFKR